MSDYFLELGKATAAALARQPDTRERLRDFADGALTRHIAGPRGMARDAMPTALKPSAAKPTSTVGKPSTTVPRPSTEDNNMPYRRSARDQDPSMPPRGREDPYGNGDQEVGEGEGAAPLDASQCLSYVQQMLDVLPPEEHDQLVAALAELIQDAHTNGGVNGVNGDQGFPTSGAMNNNAGSLDRGMRSGNRGARDSRRPAQDAAIQQAQNRAFQARWAKEVGHLDVMGRR